MGHQYFHVPGIGRLAIEYVVTNGRAADLFADPRELGQAKAQTSILNRKLRRPHARVLDHLPLYRQDRDQFPKCYPQELWLEWVQFLADEGSDFLKKAREITVVCLAHRISYVTLTGL